MKTINVSYSGNSSLKNKIVISGSKSESIRAIFINHLLNNSQNLLNLSDSDDAILMHNCLDLIKKHKHSNELIEINAKNSAAVYRILTSYLSVTPGFWKLCGTDRMNLRPIKDLVNPLIGLGAEIKYLNNDGFPPLIIKGNYLMGSNTTIDTTISSQYLTSLLLSAALFKNGLTIKVHGTKASKKYIDLTLHILRHFGLTVNINNDNISITGNIQLRDTYTIESDWSSAAFWFQIASLVKDADICLSSFKQNSFQGDSIIPLIYKQLGVDSSFSNDNIFLTKNNTNIENFSFNFANYPDIVLPIAVSCAIKGIKATFIGVKNLIYKESNRIMALKYNLALIGVNLKILNEDSFEINSEKKINPPQTAFNTFDDHRVAMSFAPLSIIFGSVHIENPDIVSKSYPNYWNDLINCGFSIEELK